MNGAGRKPPVTFDGRTEQKRHRETNSWPKRQQPMEATEAAAVTVGCLLRECCRRESLGSCSVSGTHSTAIIRSGELWHWNCSNCDKSCSSCKLLYLAHLKTVHSPSTSRVKSSSDARRSRFFEPKNQPQIQRRSRAGAQLSNPDNRRCGNCRCQSQCDV